MVILRTNGLTKAVHGKEIVSGVSMNVRKGEIYGFLGPNGAGKTTVMKMVTNLVKPTSGTVELFGQPLTPRSYEELGRIGSIIEHPIFYEKLSAYQNLELHCEYMGYYNQAAIGKALEMVGLEQTGKEPVHTFSLGMKQRLGIARAIITKPELLILDEPINSLDPAGIKEMRNMFVLLSKEYGITLLISSHILSEIEQIADTVGVISKGRLIREVSMDSIREQNTEYLELVTSNVTKAAYVIGHELGIQGFKIVSENTIRIFEPGASTTDVSKALVLNDVSIDALNKTYASLEDYFMSLIGSGSAASQRDRG
jgi:ABC-2 type transport system ATP-binding protein